MICDFRPFVSISNVEINKFLEVYAGPLLFLGIVKKKIDVPEL